MSIGYSDKAEGFNLTEEKNNRGLVFSIERYAIYDGPGIRTIIFLKGCPLNCLWCANPEGQSSIPSLVLLPDKCIGCGRCVEVCPTHAGHKMESGHFWVDRELCENCGLCAEACYSGARVIFGKVMYVNQVIDEIMKDIVFYKNSGGGVTLSGGEPLAQARFAQEILKECKNKGINTAIETSGFGPWKDLKSILEYTDLVLYDIKHMNSQKHFEGTGRDNELILENAKKIAMLNIPMIIRLPVIPEFNDSEDNIEELLTFAKELKVKEIDFLPYHELGVAKYNQLGRKCRFGHKKSFKEETAKKFKNRAELWGFKSKVGG